MSKRWCRRYCQSFLPKPVPIIVPKSGLVESIIPSQLWICSYNQIGHVIWSHWYPCHVKAAREWVRCGRIKCAHFFIIITKLVVQIVRIIIIKIVSIGEVSMRCRITESNKIGKQMHRIIANLLIFYFKIAIV